jgi:hypothetical protein
MRFSAISRLFSSICADSFSASLLIVISDKSCVVTTFARLPVMVIEESELFIMFRSFRRDIHISIYRQEDIYISQCSCHQKSYNAGAHGSRIIKLKQLFSICVADSRRAATIASRFRNSTCSRGASSIAENRYLRPSGAFARLISRALRTDSISIEEWPWTPAATTVSESYSGAAAIKIGPFLNSGQPGVSPRR